MQHCIEILATEGGSMHAANFALTRCDSEHQQQATVQPLAHPYHAHLCHPTMLWAYDSTFSFLDKLDVFCNIYVYPQLKDYVGCPGQTLC
jgi:hypothetical protein